MTCSEVRLLRTFLPRGTRRNVLEKLTLKYARGRRSASDVCLALQALKAQARLEDCDDLVAQAIAAVEPVPTVLWSWACANLDCLGCTTIRSMLAMCAGADAVARRYAKHLVPRKEHLLKTAEGFVALVHERHRFPEWAPELLRSATRQWVF